MATKRADVLAMRATEIRKCIDQTRANPSYTPEVKRHITEALVAELRRAAAEHMGGDPDAPSPALPAVEASSVARRRDERDARGAAARTNDAPGWLWSAARTASGDLTPANSSRIGGSRARDAAEQEAKMDAPPAGLAASPPHRLPASIAEARDAGSPAAKARHAQLMNHIEHLRNELADTQEKGQIADKRAARLENSHADAQSRVKGHVHAHARLTEAHAALTLKHGAVDAELEKTVAVLETTQQRLTLLTRQRDAAVESAVAAERRCESAVNENLVAQQSIKMLMEQQSSRVAPLSHQAGEGYASAKEALPPALLPMVPEPSTVPLLMQEVRDLEERAERDLAQAALDRDALRNECDTLREIIGMKEGMLCASEAQRLIWQQRAAAFEVATANAHDAASAEFLAAKDADTTAHAVVAAGGDAILTAVLEEDPVSGEIMLRVVSNDKTVRATSAMLRAAELAQVTSGVGAAETVRAQLGLAWKGLYELQQRYESLRAQHQDAELPQLDFQSDCAEAKLALGEALRLIDEAEQAKEEDAAKLARALEQSSEHLANALALKEDGDIGLRVAASKVAGQLTGAAKDAYVSIFVHEAESAIRDMSNSGGQQQLLTNGSGAGGGGPSGVSIFVHGEENQLPPSSTVQLNGRLNGDGGGFELPSRNSNGPPTGFHLSPSRTPSRASSIGRAPLRGSGSASPSAAIAADFRSASGTRTPLTAADEYRRRRAAVSVRTVTMDDGHRKQYLRDGTEVDHFIDGTVLEQHPDGSSVISTVQVDGSRCVIETAVDGTVLSRVVPGRQERAPPAAAPGGSSSGGHDERTAAAAAFAKAAKEAKLPYSGHSQSSAARTPLPGARPAAAASVNVNRSGSIFISR